MAELNVHNIHKQHRWTQAGGYVEDIYDRGKNEYPKVMYHRDYVHDKKEGLDYPHTANAVTVNSAEEEEELGPEWADNPAAHGHITAPDAAEILKRKRRAASEGADWRSAIGVPSADITELHVKFLQAHGRKDIENVAQAYQLLSTFTSAQMRSFLADAAAWGKKKTKALPSEEEGQSSEAEGEPESSETPKRRRNR